MTDTSGYLYNYFINLIQANVAKRVAIVEEENKRSLPHNDLADSERQRIFSDR